MKQKNATLDEVQNLLREFAIDMHHLSEAQLVTDRQFKETDKKFLVTDRQFKETDKKFLETDRQFKETDKKFLETDRQFKKTDKMFQELDLFLIEVGKRIDEQGKQIGGVHKSFGNFTEDLLFNSLHLQMQNKFNLEFFDTNVCRSLKGEEFEADALAFSNGTSNRLFVIEVKTRFNKTVLKQITKKLSDVNKFCPEHKTKKKYGVIAVPHLKQSEVQEILKAGFYPATLKSDMLVIEYPPDFKPKVY
ncbi:MAG: hypothetical protein HW421_1491 [Ignavibacteria bacterium]|nr:hypothetical protein [Ignavibacteria bacterium]